MANEFKKGIILGLWGDPGLTEAYQAALYSRFLIVQITEGDVNGELSPIGVKGPFDKLQLVLRPKHLWINQSNVFRTDYYGKTSEIISIDPANNSLKFKSENIQNISAPYKVGDIISLRKLEKPLNKDNPVFDGVDVFAKDGSLPIQMSTKYKESAGISDNFWNSNSIKPYINSRGICFQFNFLNQRNVFHAYLIAVYKYLKSIGWKPKSGTDDYINFFREFQSVVKDRAGGFLETYYFSQINYIDNNSEGRKRDYSVDHCVPLVIANPSSFPLPAERIVGGINITL